MLMFWRVLCDRRMRFLVFCLVVMTAGMLMQIFLLAYYLAPFTAVFYGLGLQAMRHLRVAKLEGLQVGVGLVRIIVVLCIVLCGVRLVAGPLHIDMPEWPASAWNFNWWGPVEFGKARIQIEAKLEQMPGPQLAIVRYSPEHNPLDEWVYNAANIESSKVVWAREMSAEEDRALIDYYSGRQVWLVQPDADPPKISPYPAAPISSPVQPGAPSAARYVSQSAGEWKTDSRN